MNLTPSIEMQIEEVKQFIRPSLILGRSRGWVWIGIKGIFGLAPTVAAGLLKRYNPQRGFVNSFLIRDYNKMKAQKDCFIDGIT
jgi:hypothetical protein